MKIAYFVHDLNDPAVERRVRMLRAGGADLVLLGFRRKQDPIAAVAGVAAVDLGRTYDSRMAHRAALAIARCLNPRRWRTILGDCDVFLARNLEMLSIATRARNACARDARLVYECLDIHRLMLGSSAAGAALRTLERALLRRTNLILVSSPAFVSEYFHPRQHVATPHLLIENKVFAPQAAGQSRPAGAAGRPMGPPWRIGWFGMIRCAKSLAMLSRLAQRNPGLVEVIIRGRPAHHEFVDFEGQVSALRNLRFEGPYRPEDLADHYGDVHFTWAIDYFEEGGNSAMLLSNRLYEGAFHGSVSLAQAGVESGRWVERRQAGVVLSDPAGDAETLLRALTPSAYRALSDRVAALPVESLVADIDECAALVKRLAQ